MLVSAQLLSKFEYCPLRTVFIILAFYKHNNLSLKADKSLHLLPLKSSMILRFKIRHGVLGDEQPYRPHQEATQSMKLKKFATGASASPSTKVLHG